MNHQEVVLWTRYKRCKDYSLDVREVGNSMNLTEILIRKKNFENSALKRLSVHSH